MKIKHYQSGVSLLELLISLVIFGISGLALCASTLVGIKGEQFTSNTYDAMLVAEEKINNLSIVNLEAIENYIEDEEYSNYNKRDYITKTTLTISEDRTRTIKIEVRPVLDNGKGGKISLQRSFSLSGKR